MSGAVIEHCRSFIDIPSELLNEVIQDPYGEVVQEIYSEVVQEPYGEVVQEPFIEVVHNPKQKSLVVHDTYHDVSKDLELITFHSPLELLPHFQKSIQHGQTGYVLLIVWTLL